MMRGFSDAEVRGELGLLIQFAAEELNSVISFGIHLFIAAYVLVAGGALTAFVGIMTQRPDADAVSECKG